MRAGYSRYTVFVQVVYLAQILIYTTAISRMYTGKLVRLVVSRTVGTPRGDPH